MSREHRSSHRHFQAYIALIAVENPIPNKIDFSVGVQVRCYRETRQRLIVRKCRTRSKRTVAVSERDDVWTIHVHYSVTIEIPG